jgi:hypothetical protein
VVDVDGAGFDVRADEHKYEPKCHGDPLPMMEQGRRSPGQWTSGAGEQVSCA